MLFLCGKCNTLATNVWVSTIRNNTEWSMDESALNRCPTLKSCFVWHLYDRSENENVKCVFAFAFWVPNFIWFNMKIVVKFSYILRQALTVLKFMVFLIPEGILWAKQKSSRNSCPTRNKDEETTLFLMFS